MDTTTLTPARCKLGIFVTLDAKPGKADEVADFLRGALPLVEAETGTTGWYALQLTDSQFAIFDTFANDHDRDAHLSGQVAAALMEKAPDLFDRTPLIHKVEILAAKL